MAASSSDDSSCAPRIFDISSSVEDNNNGKASFLSGSCPVCAGSKTKRGFYCRNCVQDGLFVRSASVHLPESFASKKARLSVVTRNKLSTLNLINMALADRMKANDLKREIAECRERIRLLRLLLQDTRVLVEKARTDAEWRSQENEARNRTAAVYEEKRQRMMEDHERAEEQIRQRRAVYDDCCLQLQRVIRENVDHLVKYIFPIVQVKSEDKCGADSMNEDTAIEIADASRTAYIRGRWVYSENSHDGQYKIVEALLPNNGDYSAYNDWVTASRDSIPGSSTELMHRNPGSAISAGLTCATQLVSVLAFYMDVWLPKKLCYSEFCSRELGAREFARKVAKLNANVIHLCLSQGVNPDVLRPRHTISNLILLLDTDDDGETETTASLRVSASDGGGESGSGVVVARRRLRSLWHAAFEVNADLMRCMEESLLQDLTNAGASDHDADSDDEGGGDAEGRNDLLDLFSDWETVSPQLETLNLPGRVTMSALPSPGTDASRTLLPYGPRRHYHHHQQQHHHQEQQELADATTASMAGGLISAAASVASWWRATIGHK